MKFWKKVLIYFAIILGIVVVATMACFAYMYFKPNNSLFGFEYVNYNKTAEYKYTTSTDLSVKNLKGFEIKAKSSDIYICPNGQSDEVKIVYKQGFSGFAKSVNAKIEYSANILNKSFEEDSTNTSLKTLSINVNEPTGWIGKAENTGIFVYLPGNISLDTIYAKSVGGNVFYSSTSKGATLSCKNLYLKTESNGFISISNNQAIDNYYLSTNMGNAFFKNTNSITANTIIYKTFSGDFSFTNNAKDATLNLNVLKIFSTDTKNGTDVFINNLNADLKIEAKKLNAGIKSIGSQGNLKTVSFVSNKSDISLGKVFGTVSLLQEGSKVQNNISISSLSSGSTSNVFETGQGNLKINESNCDIAFESTSGNLTLNGAKPENKIFAYTDSGSVKINYKEVTYTTFEKKLNVVTNTGNIDIKNISCLIEINVLKPSENATLNLTFSAVCYGDNFVFAQNRKCNIKLKGSNAYLIFRIFSNKDVSIADIPGGQLIDENDKDYILTTVDPKYKKSFRVGYIKSDVDSVYKNSEYLYKGKLFVTSTQSARISCIED